MARNLVRWIKRNRESRSFHAFLTAHAPVGLGAAVTDGDGKRQLPIVRPAIEREVRRIVHAGRARHRMRIAMREHHYVSRCELDRWFTRHARRAAAVRDHMVGNQMLRAGKHSADDRCACRRFCYPRLRRLNVEKDRAATATLSLPAARQPAPS
jgi:hypothetical protein